jgi:hypothetical protein
LVAISRAPAITIRTACSDHFDFADDDVIGVMVDDRIAIGMQRLQQSSFTDDERRALRLLRGQKPGGRHGAGKDVPLFDIHSHPPKSGGHIAAGSLAVVG